MILVIDSGNSRLKWALADRRQDLTGSNWLAQGVVDNTRLAQLAPMWAALPCPEQVMVSHVAGPHQEAAIRAALAVHPVAITWLQAQPACAGLINDYEQPQMLGTDRWAAAIGAWQRLHGAAIVVSAGTATTIDLIDAQGHFTGGLIMPGLAMMGRALQHGTAGLAVPSGTLRLWPRNTADAIETGCLFAQIGAIERVRRLASAGSVLILTGGAADALTPLLAAPVLLAPQLVLEGLFTVGQAELARRTG